MDIHKSIGEKLRKARNACDLTQAKVAKYLNMKREMVSYFETGSRPISLAELTRLADLYGYDLGYFISNEEVEPISLSFRASNIKGEDLEVIARIKRFANNLHFLNSLLEERGLEI